MRAEGGDVGETRHRRAALTSGNSPPPPKSGLGTGGVGSQGAPTGLPLIEQGGGTGIGTPGQLHRPRRLPCRRWSWPGSAPLLGWPWRRWWGWHLTRPDRARRRPVETLGAHQLLMSRQRPGARFVHRLSTPLTATGGGQGPARLRTSPGGSALTGPVYRRARSAADIATRLCHHNRHTM